MSRSKRHKPTLMCLAAGGRAAHIEMFTRCFRVLTADADPLEPGMQVSEGGIITPPFDDAEFGAVLAASIREHAVDVVMPGSYEAMLALDRERGRVETAGAVPLVAGSRAVAVSRDRAHMFCFFISNNIPTLRLFDPEGKISFPVYLKPADSSSSLAFLARNRAEMDFYCCHVRDAVIQQAVEGEDYSIEVFSDLDAHVLSAVPMRCLEMRHGELFKAVTAKNRAMIDYAVQAASSLGSIGPMSLKAVRCDGEIYLTEISCLLGSGATLSNRAGASPARMLAGALAGRRMRYDEDWSDGLVMTRAFRDFYFELDETSGAAIEANMAVNTPVGLDALALWA